MTVGLLIHHATYAIKSRIVARFWKTVRPDPQARAPLADFVAGALVTPLLFTPGTDHSYSSMGTLSRGR